MNSPLLPALAVACSLFVAASATAQNCLQATGAAILNGAGPDVVLPARGIGFAFPFGGGSYTHLHVCDKGYAFLSNNGVPAPPSYADFHATAADLAAEAPRLCALWTDAVALPANAAQIRFASSNLACVVTWKNLQIYAGGAVTGTRFDLRMTLLPSGEIRFDYDGRATNGSIPSQPAWQNGIVGVSPGGGTHAAAAERLLAERRHRRRVGLPGLRGQRGVRPARPDRVVDAERFRLARAGRRQQLRDDARVRLGVPGFGVSAQQ